MQQKPPPAGSSAVQPDAGNSLPSSVKSSLEKLSGKDMDSVKVHTDKSGRASLDARAYAQGSDIHLAAGQEQHLPHEAAHVVQQKQGRVKPAGQ
jgi:hypothetical protein